MRVTPVSGLPKRAFRRVVRSVARPGSIGQPHVTRYAMYRAMSGQLSAEGTPDRRTLAISGSGTLAAVVGLGGTQITNTAYPEHDIRSLRFADETYDFIVSDQVLEHVEADPFDVMAECFRVLKPGGVGVHATCFVNPIHGHPSDFWRFTPAALELLVRAHGAVMTSGAWGNRQVWALERLGLRFAPIPDRRWHPLHLIATHNDPLWPIVTWVVARKAGPTSETHR